MAFARAAGEGETNRMKKVPAADAAGVSKFPDNLFESFGGQWNGIEQQRGELTDHFPSVMASKHGMRVWQLENFVGIVVENKSKQVAKLRRIFREDAQE